MRTPTCLFVLFFLFLLSFSPGLMAQKMDHLEGTFTETGTLPCVRIDSGKSYDCPYGVVRVQPGVAELHVLSPVKYERVFYFKGPVVEMTDEEARLTIERDDERWIITYNGREKYTVPVAVIGG